MRARSRSGGHRRFVRHPVARYALALAAAWAATAVLYPFRAFPEILPSPPFLLAIVLVTWIAGPGPGIVTAVLGLVALDYYFVPPLYSFEHTWRDTIWIPVFLGTAAVLVRIVATRRRIEDARGAALARELVARERAERVAERLRALQAVVDASLPHVGVEEMLQAVLRPVRTAIGVDAATALLVDADGGHLRLVATDGVAGAAPAPERVPLAAGLASRIAASPSGVIVEHPADDGLVPRPAGAAPLGSLAGVALRVEDRLVGLLCVASVDPHRLTADDLVLLRLVAQRAVLGIERARLLESEREARTAAEEANRAKDEFLAVLGHELRNPLGAIATAAHVLERVSKPDEIAARAREVIARQAKALGRMVDDLLEVNRVLTGKILLDRRALDLADAVRRALATLSGAGRVEQHVLRVEVDPVWVEADAGRLEQVIVNLLDNALKYTPPGGAIHVSLAHEGGAAVLRVRDSGVGISADLLPRIFEPFVQGELASHRARGGLGIGLAVVRRLVELHGGSVEAASDGPDRGSTFTLRLPAAPRPLPPAPRPERVRPAGPPRRVLIVEDDDDMRAMLRQLLELAGHEVHDAADAATAIEVDAAVRPEVVLIDIGLPGIDGWELARRLRRTPRRRPPVLVAVTGLARPSERERSLAAGFDRHLVKPVDPAMLAEVLAPAAPEPP